MAPETNTRNRRTLITVTLFAVAFILCGIAWMRFFTAAATNPSPVRYVDFVGESGARDPFRQECAGPAFIEVDMVWRFCEYGPNSPQWGLVRFNLEDGQASMLWPLPEGPDAQVLALAKADDGALALAWGSPQLSAVYLVNMAGGVIALDVPDDALSRLSGMAWVEGGLELATASVGRSLSGGDGARVNRFEGGTWNPARAVTLPPECAGDTICSYQFAHLSDDGWLFLYAAAPQARATLVAEADTPVDFLLADEAGASTLVDSVLLSDLDPGQYHVDEAGRLVGFGDLFDQAPGNVVNWSIDAAPFMLHGGTWERVAAPPLGDELNPGGGSFYFSNYQIKDGGLRWIPGLRFPQRGWQLDSWLMLKSTGKGIVLAEFNGAQGDALTQDDALLTAGGAQTELLPASDGGYWILGPYGAYLKTDAGLDRADGLNVFERVGRMAESFTRLEPVSDDFYREQRALKLAAFPLVLLSLPAGYVLVFVVNQTRQQRRAGLTMLAQVSALYLVLATVFIWWFWEMMNDF